MGDAVFLALPSYDAAIDANAAIACFNGATKRKLVTSAQGGSLLAFTFNGLWCTALNHRESHGIKWFAMLHSDIVPDAGWIDTLIAEAEVRDADVMSAVVPIKSPEGLTSTAIENPNDPWEPLFRMTLKQIADPLFPATFDWLDAVAALGSPENKAGKVDILGHRPQPKLLVNTGCFVARFDRPWVEQVRFTIQDRIYKDADGQFRCSVISEDWQFSKDVAALGGRVMATKKVRVIHRGVADFDSRGTWGLERDHLCEKNGL